MAKMSIPHYAWAAGHALVLLTSVYTILGQVTRTPHPYAYKMAYMGALVSWGIVVYKSLGTPSPSRAYVQRALLDENVQYLLLAAYWGFLERPIPLTLVPFATFSLFHTLTFIRSLLPKAPSSASKKNAAGDKSTPAQPAQPPSAAANVNKQLQTWIKKNYESAMTFVAFYEVIALMARVAFGAIIFKNSFGTPIVMAMFLRLRYYQSTQTRDAFTFVSGQVDRAQAHPSVPEPVKRGLGIARDLVIRYGSSILAQQGPAANGQPAAQPAR